MAIDDNYTKALLHFDGADGSTTFIDESGKIWTARDNAQIDTAQSVFGGASGLFDGTNDSIDTPDSDDFNFADANLTIDLRVRLAGVGARRALINQFVQGDAAAGSFAIEITDADKLSFGYCYGTTYDSTISVSTTLSINTWYHLAVVRSGVNLYLFQDGIQVNTTHNIGTRTLNDSAQIMRVGIDNTGTGDMYGWIDELRISKGIARWTADFTPPTSAYMPYVPPTSLLAPMWFL